MIIIPRRKNIFFNVSKLIIDIIFKLWNCCLITKMNHLSKSRHQNVKMTLKKKMNLTAAVPIIFLSLIILAKGLTKIFN